jgi:hypothetical protein
MADASSYMVAHPPIPARSSLPALLLLLLGFTCARAQDAATVQLQQEVLELKRVNQQMERRIETLERQLAGQGGVAGAAPGARAASTGGNPLPGSPVALSWMNTADWDRLKPGTQELEVIRILGVPNSLRHAANGQQVLYYALEIGTGSFLSGSVTLADHRVVEVQKPTLK